MVGLGLPKVPKAEGAEDRAAPSGLTGLGKPAAAPSGLTGLGKPAAAPSGLTGLGKPAAAPAGLTGLGKPAAAPAGLTGLGKPSPGLAGLGTPAPAAPAPAAPAPAAVPRKSGIAIHESAATRIQKLLGDRGTPEAGLRIRVRGGGCTGLTYDMEFAEDPKERDRVFEGHGVRIFVDPKSYIFLIGTELKYQSGLMESGFKLENPNAKKSCGCGDSFSV